MTMAVAVRDIRDGGMETSQAVGGTRSGGRQEDSLGSTDVCS